MSQPADRRLKTVIFDFDGTLADSLAIFINAGEQLLQMEKPLSKKEVQHLRTLSPLQVMRRFNIKAWQIPKLVIEGRQIMAEKIDTVKLYAGIPEILKTLKTQGYTILIVSTNSEESINKVLQRYNLTSVIDGMAAGAGFANKATLIKRLIKKQGMDSTRCVYVGDEVRDIQAARAAKLPSIAVSWGFQAREVLAKKNPTILIDKPAEFLPALKTI